MPVMTPGVRISTPHGQGGQVARLDRTPGAAGEIAASAEHVPTGDVLGGPHYR